MCASWEGKGVLDELGPPFLSTPTPKPVLLLAISKTCKYPTVFWTCIWRWRGGGRDKEGEGAGRAHLLWWVGQKCPRTGAEICNWLRDSTPREKHGKFTIVCMWVCGFREEKNVHSLKERRVKLPAGQDCENKTRYGCNTLVQSVLLAQLCKRLKEITGAVSQSV